MTIHYEIIFRATLRTVLCIVSFAVITPVFAQAPPLLISTEEYAEGAARTAQILSERAGMELKWQVLPQKEFAAAIRSKTADFFLTTFTQSRNLNELHGLDLQKHASSVGTAGIEKIHLISRKKEKIRTLHDLLKGKSKGAISLGPKQSATQRDAIAALSAQRHISKNDKFGCADRVPFGDLTCEDHSYDEQHSLLIAGKIRAYFQTGTVPILTIQIAASQLWVAEISAEVVTKMIENSHVDYVQTKINMDHYGTPRLKIPTGGIGAFVGATSRATDDQKKLVVEALYQQNPEFTAFVLRKGPAQVAKWLPIDPIAQKYFESVGLKVE